MGKFGESLSCGIITGNRLMPPSGERPDASVNRGEFRVDVRKHDEDVIVVADLPGVNKESAALQLANLPIS